MARAVLPRAATMKSARMRRISSVIRSARVCTSSRRSTGVHFSGICWKKRPCPRGHGHLERHRALDRGAAVGDVVAEVEAVELGGRLVDRLVEEEDRQHDVFAGVLDTQPESRTGRRTHRSSGGQRRRTRSPPWSRRAPWSSGRSRSTTQAHAADLVVRHLDVIGVTKGLDVREGEVREVEEVVDHLRRTCVPRLIRERGDDGSRDRPLGDLDDRSEWLIGAQPHEPVTLDDEESAARTRAFGGIADPGPEGGDRRAPPVGVEPVAVVHALDAPVNHTPEAKRRPPVSTAVGRAR